MEFFKKAHANTQVLYSDLWSFMELERFQLSSHTLMFEIFINFLNSK